MILDGRSLIHWLNNGYDLETILTMMMAGQFIQDLD